MTKVAAHRYLAFLLREQERICDLQQTIYPPGGSGAPPSKKLHNRWDSYGLPAPWPPATPARTIRHRRVNCYRVAIGETPRAQRGSRDDSGP